MQNFSTPRSILAALDSSTISRLHQTWSVSAAKTSKSVTLLFTCLIQGLPQKNRQQLEAIRALADHARNYHTYRQRLRTTAPPAIPFLGEYSLILKSRLITHHFCVLGLYLTDITFCREGNPSHRASPKNPDKKLLNFNKYHKLARIVQGMIFIDPSLISSLTLSASRHAKIPSAL